MSLSGLLLCSVAATTAFGTPPRKLPTSSICSKLCPQCTTGPENCDCPDSCWPGQSLDNTPDHTCECFAHLGFCANGTKPVYTPGQKCPSCWPADNHACDCFAAIGFCEPPAKLPETSQCSTLCPDCKSVGCKCDDSCWPGSGLNRTNDHTCECFAELGFCAAGTKPVYTKGKKCPSCWDPENHACDCFASIGFCEPPQKLPTSSQCQTLCPDCKSVGCKCDDSCWPGSGLDRTNDHTCECFAELGFCAAGTKPVYTPGKKCPSCWDPENHACDCFASIGFCEPPQKLPTSSRCQTLCPDCKSPTCKCDACWPGKGLNQTCDHTCECFAELGFCAAGTKPVFTPGKKCPSCWDPENHACDCFAAVGFCGDTAVAML